MADISFYHLTHSSVVDALRSLLGKALESDKQVLLYHNDVAMLKMLDDALWEHPADSFLPHGLDSDEAPETQPILLTSKEENLNEAEFLFTLDGCEPDFAAQFERCFDMFDGKDEQAVGRARLRWKAYASNADNSLHYWKQDGQGKWKKEK